MSTKAIRTSLHAIFDGLPIGERVACSTIYEAINRRLARLDTLGVEVAKLAAGKPAGLAPEEIARRSALITAEMQAILETFPATTDTMKAARDAALALFPQ